MRKVLDFILVLFSLAVAVFVYSNFNMEGILWNGNKPDAVSSQEMEENPGTVYTGKPAGDGVPQVKTQEEWNEVLNDVDYVTITPKKIYKTNVYSLAEWADYFQRRRNGSVGRKKATVKETPLDISRDYTPYYIIELEDGSHILAQINRCLAKNIAKGKETPLPVGRKQGFSQGAKSLLAPVCEEYQAPADYVFYAIDNEWQEKHSFEILIGKTVVAVIVFFVLAVVLELIADRIWPSRKSRDSE